MLQVKDIPLPDDPPVKLSSPTWADISESFKVKPNKEVKSSPGIEFGSIMADTEEEVPVRRGRSRSKSMDKDVSATINRTIRNARANSTEADPGTPKRRSRRLSQGSENEIPENNSDAQAAPTKSLDIIQEINETTESPVKSQTDDTLKQNLNPDEIPHPKKLNDMKNGNESPKKELNVDTK